MLFSVRIIFLIIQRMSSTTLIFVTQVTTQQEDADFIISRESSLEVLKVGNLTIDTVWDLLLNQETLCTFLVLTKLNESSWEE